VEGGWVDRVELNQLEPSLAIRGLEHRNVRPDALEAHHTVNPTALDQPFALQLESKLDKERCGGGEVVDHDAHVIHASDRHAFNGRPHPEPTGRSPSSSCVFAPTGLLF